MKAAVGLRHQMKTRTSWRCYVCWDERQQWTWLVLIFFERSAPQAVPRLDMLTLVCKILKNYKLKSKLQKLAMIP